MELRYHFLVSLLAVPIYWRTGDIWSSLLFFAGAFLIDSDHYLLSVWNTKDLSVMKSYRHWEGTINKLKNGGGHPYVNFIFHSFEVFFVVAMASIYYSNYYLLLGMSTHLAMDIIHMYKNYGVFFGMKRWSLFQKYWDKRAVFRPLPGHRESKKRSHPTKRR